MKAEGVKRMNGELNHDFLNCTNSPCDSRTQSGDINDIYGNVDSTGVIHALHIGT